MKQHKTVWAFALAIITAMTSCVSDDETTTVLRNDAAITTFTLGTVNRYLRKTTPAGKDTVVRTKTDGSLYKFHIDQYGGQIYNTDSLPYGCDAAHVQCLVTTMNNGFVTYLNDKEDSTYYYSSSDSIDFSYPRKFCVVASDGSYIRRYTVKVNVHQTKDSVFAWSKAATISDFAQLEGMKAVAVGGNLVVLGKSGSNTAAYVSTDGGNEWNKAATVSATDGNGYNNVAVRNGLIYIMCDETVYCSENGTDWIKSNISTQGVRQIIGAGANALYALSESNELLVNYDGSDKWEKDTLSNGAQMLPTENVSIVGSPYKADNGVEYLLLAGNRSGVEYAQDTTAVAWYRLADKADAGQSSRWINMPIDPYNRYYFPRLDNLTVFAYDGHYFAVGGNDKGGRQEKAYADFFCSKDKGITWKKDGHYFFPEGFETVMGITIAVDADNNIWLFGAKGGEVYKGKLSSAGWKR